MTLLNTSIILYYEIKKSLKFDNKGFYCIYNCTMKPEQKLYHLFKKNCPEILITRLELYSAPGVSDLLLYNQLNGFSLLELKIQTGNKIKFSPHQILFHTTRNKRNYILVQTASGSRSTVKLYSSKSIEGLTLDPRATAPLAVDNWPQIQKILIS